MKKNRTDWDRFLYFLRHPLNYIRASAIKELRRRRELEETLCYLHKENMRKYDRQFEREWRKQMRDMHKPSSTKYSSLPPVNIGC